MYTDIPKLYIITCKCSLEHWNIWNFSDTLNRIYVNVHICIYRVCKCICIQEQPLATYSTNKLIAD